jgi:predicted DNA-binding transcriptional regulator AlpA
MQTDTHAPEASGTLPELLAKPEAARLCGLGARTLDRYAALGLAPRPVKLGPAKQAAVRWRRADLLSWIAAGCPRCDGGHADG